MTFSIRKSLTITEIIGQVVPETIYVQDLNISVYFHSEATRATFRICDLANAWEVGKNCVEYAMRVEYDPSGNAFSTLARALRAWSDIPDLLTGLSKIAWDQDHGIDTVSDNGVTLTRRFPKGARTWSPFKKPAALKVFPAKWTIPHAMRALANGQFQGLRCNARYTDDYAYDASVNFERGRIRSADAFVRDIVEDPSGWRCYHDGKDVRVCCHSFDSNSFIPVLVPADNSKAAA